MMREKTAAFCTLGCRVNQYESDAMAHELSVRGWDIRPFSEPCSVYIINTCAVTAESERKSRQMIRRARNTSPGAFVAVCGCYSQIKPGEAAELADLVCGTRNKMAAVEAAERFAGGLDPSAVSVPDPSSLPYEPLFAPHTDRTRAFVKIEDGCDGKCTYCIIKEARGKVVSRSEDDILNELERLYDAGYPEAVLTGIETAAYGRDTGTDLLGLLEKASASKCPPRLRLGSIDPAWLTRERSARLSAIPGFLPHIHLSVQSGSSAVLAAMKRKYNADMLYENVAACRENIPGVRFSADIIAGFPGETEKDFGKTVEFLDFADLVHAHIFPFSERKGTSAATMAGRLDKKTKAERAARLSAHQARIEERDAEEAKGTFARVLFEENSGGFAYGHTDDFRYVRVRTDEKLHGRIVTVVLTGYCDGTYEAELVKG